MMQEITGEPPAMWGTASSALAPARETPVMLTSAIILIRAILGLLGYSGDFVLAVLSTR
jgi:hypothetical protein